MAPPLRSTFPAPTFSRRDPPFSVAVRGERRQLNRCSDRVQVSRQQRFDQPLRDHNRQSGGGRGGAYSPVTAGPSAPCAGFARRSRTYSPGPISFDDRQR